MRCVARWRGVGGREEGGSVVLVQRIGGVPVEMDSRRSWRGSCCWESDAMAGGPWYGVLGLAVN